MIRGLHRDDLPQVAALDSALFGAEGWTSEAWEGLLAAVGRRAWVGTGSEGQVAGYALAGLVGDFAELLRIGVHPDVRRRGMARRLLAATTTAAASAGADRMLLEVGADNAAATAFYAAVGFEVIDRRPRYYRDGQDALVMRRVLGERAPGEGMMGP